MLGRPLSITKIGPINNPPKNLTSRHRGVARNLLKETNKGFGEGIPQRDPEAEYGNPREHERDRDKN